MEQPFTLWHYDGESGLRRTPRLIADDAGFTLVDERGSDGPIGWDALVARGTSGGEAVYGLKERPGWRLGLGGAIPEEIARRLPQPERYGGFIDRIGLVRASAIFLAIAATVVFAVMSAPRWIAPHVPPSFEKKLGDAIVGDFGGRFCNGPGGQAALDALTRQLNPKRLPLEVRVAKVPMVNAVALPGGKIVIFDQLLKEANSADEVAGVLGHEIGHVQNRDVMQALLRQAGLSVILGGMSGDAGGYFNALLSATYSREAERAADDASIAAMKRAQISPAATAGFFARLGVMEKKLGQASVALNYLSSHPLSGDRERLFADSAARNAQYRPALTRDQWEALVDICSNDPDVKDDMGWLGR
ncbi:peptidase [Sphingomonas cavernae]|uniref:Peptidase n=1 Tax=Sphingomonas cavernae TaxID=2320861 RepID=A0A418WQR0_9SPHN|nr:peptidase [Sphingomonas cavernae]